MHYYTDEPGKIIDQIKRREEKALTRYAEEQSFNEIYEKWDMRLYQGMYRLSIDEIYEQVIVKQWANCISTYPIIVTQCQVENQTWVKFDTRKKSIAQKYGAVFTWKDGERIHLELLKLGKIIIEEEYEPVTIERVNQNTLCSIASNEFLQAWVDCCPAGADRRCSTDFALFLPEDWNNHWIVKKTSRLVQYCI